MEKIIFELLQSDLIEMDACFAMREEFNSFVERVELEFMACNKRIIVSRAVVAELYRHMGSRDERKREIAVNAVNAIFLRRNIFDIHDENINSGYIRTSFADAEFLADFTRNRIKNKMALLTNDYRLGKDIDGLNRLESCYGKEITVFALNRSGALERICYEEEYSSEEVFDQEEIQEAATAESEEVEMEIRNEWRGIIFSSIASFAVGVVVNKYGKQIVDTVVKAVA